MRPHKNTRTRRRLMRQGVCWICRGPLVGEIGQRGPRRAHATCRRLADDGVAFTEIRRQQADAPLVGLA